MYVGFAIDAIEPSERIGTGRTLWPGMSLRAMLSGIAGTLNNSSLSRPLDFGKKRAAVQEVPTVQPLCVGTVPVELPRSYRRLPCVYSRYNSSLLFLVVVAHDDQAVSAQRAPPDRPAAPVLITRACRRGRRNRNLPQQLTIDHVSPATRLLEKRRQMFEVQEALDAQKEGASCSLRGQRGMQRAAAALAGLLSFLRCLPTYCHYLRFVCAIHRV